MSGIFGLSKNATTPTVYNSIQLQSSSQAIAVPVYYGTNRGAPNLLWYGGFRKTQVQSSGKGGIGSVSAGKGGGSGQFNYFADVILGVSEGPVQGFGQAWASKTPTTLASLGMTSFLGTYPQTAWSYVTGAYPTEARPYTGLAYLAASGYQLGSAAELPAHTFEVYGFFSQRTVYETGTIPGSGARTITVARRAWANGSTVSLWVSDGNSVVDSNGNVFAKVVGAPGAGQYSVLLGVYTFNAADAGKSVTIAYTGKGQDADPSLIVPDILSNANYGCGFPSAHVGELTAYSEDFVIPGGLSVAVAHAAGFDDNLSVYQAAADQLFTCVASGPGPLQYSYLAGVYTFNAADIGKTVSIAYAALGGLTTYQQYCWANGFFISPVYRSLTTGAAALDEIGKLTNSEVVFSAGALKLVPRGDQTITANGYTYTAPSATVADFTDDQFLNGNQGGGASGQAANDPVILTRKRQSDQRNVVSIECLDRANQYNSAVVEATDQAQVDLYGRRSTGGQQAHIFCVPTIAKQSCQLLLQREAIRNQYAFTLDARWVWLDPMDVISVTDTRLGLSTSDWLRIVSIDEQGNGDLAVIAEEYLTGISSAQAYTFGTGTGYAANYQADPGSVNTPIVFEPTVQLATNTGLEIWCAVSGANPNWGGCDIYVSSDNVTYNFVGRKWGNSRMGTLVGSPILNGTPNFRDQNSQVGLKTRLLGSGPPYFPGLAPSAFGAAFDSVRRYGSLLPGMSAGPDVGTLMGPLGASNASVDSFFDFAAASRRVVSDLTTTYGSTTRNSRATFHAIVRTPRVISGLSNSVRPLDPDTIDTLTVDLTESFGALASGTAADADAGNTLCIVDSELISFSTVALIATYTYNLTGYVRRAQYGTTPAVHLPGAPFARLDGNIFTFPYDKSKLGSTVYLKFCSFNLWGGGLQDLSVATAYPHTIVGPPTPGLVQNFTANQAGLAVVLSWTDLDDLSVKGYDILYGPIGGTVATATMLTAASRTTETTTAAVGVGSWTFYIRARNVVDQFGPVSTVNALVLASSQIFTVNGIWTKPQNLPANAIARIQVWGSGGGGGPNSTGSGGGGGGGGGAYVEDNILCSMLGVTETVTVAAAVSGDTAGNPSSFGSWVIAYGGGKGGASVNAVAAGGGGGGGGAAGVGANGQTNGGGEGGQPWAFGGEAGYTLGATTGGLGLYGAGGGVGGLSPNGSGSSGGRASDGGGGGGGGGADGAGSGNMGGGSINGGGGGRGAGPGSAALPYPSGISVNGGNGGSVAGQSGSAPAGGGAGGLSGTPPGGGARGEVRITILQ
jgi:hypothetical protein